MTKYRAYGKVVGTKYLGEYEASSEEEAIKLAQESENRAVCLCHYCNSECEDPEIEEIFVEVDAE